MPACAKPARKARAPVVINKKPPPAAKPVKAPVGKVPCVNEQHRFIMAARGCKGIDPAVTEKIETNRVGFGHQDMQDPSSCYLRMPGSTGGVTTKNELGLIVTDFFDYNSFDPESGGVAQEVTNYFWSIDQNLFENDVASSASRTFCRVRSLEVYVLPQTGLDVSGDNRPNKSNATGMYTVNAQVPGVAALSQAGAGYSATALAADTQVTNILPQIDTFWKCVLKCNLDKTFKSGVMRPFFASANNVVRDQCLFSMSIVDSTTGQSYFSSSDDTFKIRVKVVMHIDQPVATSQKASLCVFRNEDFALPSTAQNGSNYPSTASEYVQMYCTGKMDAFH
jgi:hypothetical protein